ncbi:MAG: ComEC/Rec2 family competence protein [Planctomycetaceae bacterium]
MRTTHPSTSTLSPAAPPSRRSASGRRAPALPVTAALCVGILVDRFTGLSVVVWIAAAVIALASSRASGRRGATWAATFLLLIVCCSLGGLRHHLHWSTVGPHDVSRHAASEPIPIRLIGVIDSPVTVEPADRSPMTPSWMRIDRSQCDVRCESLLGRVGAVPTTGRLRMFATGHVLHANVGDRVEVTGRLIQPRGLLNPGGFDYRSFLLRSGIRGLLNVEHPDAVRVLEPLVTGRLARTRARLRDECERILVHHLDPRSVPLAMSLLLGERSSLPQDVREAFAESGMTHVLAISGLHVGILATLLLVLCRIFQLPMPMTAVVLVAGVLAYAFVTNHRPPVIRASVLAVTVAAGWPWFRRAGGVNLIALCAAIVLLINPTDLFDVGAQLSFLSMIAIGWSVTVTSGWRANPWRSEWADWLFDPYAGLGTSLLRWLLEGYLVTAAIWFVAIPLIAARFHIVSLVGFPINVFLIPFVVIVLWLGFVTLFCGLLAPWVVHWPASALDGSLQVLQDIVGTAAQWHLGHFSVAGPADWWLIGFYALLAMAIVVRPGYRLRRAAWGGVGAWVLMGLTLPLLPHHRDGVRCTFLSVGHGCAVVLELPGGETLLYDAGMFSGARRGQSIIQSALWERGITGLDAVIVSPADVDHFNAAAGLLQTMPVGMLLCPRSFLDFTQEPVAELCETASRERVPVRLLQAADRLLVGDEDVELTVLHPPPGWRSERDNANSLVLRIRYAGRTVLLTGDLEHDGLTHLLNQPPESVDVLLSPHHGSPKANPAALSRWASPRSVVISGGDADSEAALRGVYDRAERVLSTHNRGAVVAAITASGKLSIAPWIAAE